MRERGRRRAALIIVSVLAVLVLASIVFPEARGVFSQQSLKALIERAGLWAPAVMVAMMAVAIIFSPLPNVPISAVLGMVYGAWIGTGLAVAGAILGASAAFWIARTQGQRVVRIFTGRNAHFCSGCSTRTLIILVFASRLIPIVSFDIVSYGAGMSRIPFRHFLWTSLLGMIPWTWFYTAVGATVLGRPALAAILGVLLAAAVLLLPWAVRRWNPFGLRRIMMGSPDGDMSRNALNADTEQDDDERDEQYVNRHG